MTRPSAMAIPYVLDAAHLLADRAIRRGDLTIDATVGNGHDTLFLVRSVGPEGRVVGFDIQRGAINETRRRMQADAPDTALHLIHAGHETMAWMRWRAVSGTSACTRRRVSFRAPC